MVENHSPVVVQAIRDRLDRLQAEQHSLDLRLSEIEADIDMLRRWLADEQRSASRSESEPIRSSSSQIDGEFSGMSVRRAMHAIAESNSHLLVVRDAIRLLIRAGYYPDSKSASPPIYARIGQGVKKGEWEKKEPGVYVQKRNPFNDANGNSLDTSRTEPARPSQWIDQDSQHRLGEPVTEH